MTKASALEGRGQGAGGRRFSPSLPPNLVQASPSKEKCNWERLESSSNCPHKSHLPTASCLFQPLDFGQIGEFGASETGKIAMGVRNLLGCVS